MVFFIFLSVLLMSDMERLVTVTLALSVREHTGITSKKLRISLRIAGDSFVDWYSRIGSNFIRLSSNTDQRHVSIRSKYLGHGIETRNRVDAESAT